MFFWDGQLWGLLSKNETNKGQLILDKPLPKDDWLFVSFTFSTEGHAGLYAGISLDNFRQKTSTQFVKAPILVLRSLSL